MNRLLLIAGILGASGVLLGAFGAHGLEGALTRGMAEIDPVWLAKRLDQFDVGVRYHLLHAVALLVLALSGDAVTPRLRMVTGSFGSSVFWSSAACSMPWS